MGGCSGGRGCAGSRYVIPALGTILCSALRNTVLRLWTNNLFCHPLKNPSLWVSHVQWLHRALTYQRLCNDLHGRFLWCPCQNYGITKQCSHATAPSRYPLYAFQERTWPYTLCWKYSSFTLYLPRNIVVACFWDAALSFVTSQINCHTYSS